MRLFAAFLVLALASALALPAAAADPTPGGQSARGALPDPALTPGAIVSTATAVICRRGYSRAHRVWRDKVGTLEKYGLPLSAMRSVEDDDLVPVALGGDNASPLNHWPMPRGGPAEAKDALEWRLAREVCRAHDDERGLPRS